MLFDKDFYANDASIEENFIWGLFNEGLFKYFSKCNV